MEPLLLIPRAVVVAAAVGMAAAVVITKQVLVEYRTVAAAVALVTSMPHELHYRYPQEVVKEQLPPDSRVVERAISMLRPLVVAVLVVQQQLLLQLVVTA